MTEKTIYFICTGNSCRSQMAEGLAKKILGEDWKVYSGGIEAHGINRDAATVMSEIGTDITKQESSLIDMELFNKADLVVTLCSDADQNCPVVPPNVKKEHWGFEDPAGQELEKFREVRNKIQKRIIKFKNESL